MNPTNPAAVLERIDQTIAAHALMPDGIRILVAVSGGADSILLLHALHQLSAKHRWSLTVAHLDHGLRGDQDRADTAFVQAVAQRLGWPLLSERADVRQLARNQRISIEMAGRAARRLFLAQAARHADAAVAATGHTADDRVETLLLNMARGVGIGALSAIPYRVALPDSDVSLVRPLLDVDRASIEVWLRQRNLAWRDDPSNTDPVYRRNRVRHELLPWLETRLNPRVREALRRLLQQANVEQEWIQALVEETARQCLIEPLLADRSSGLPALAALAADRLAIHPTALRRRVLHLWLQRLAVPAERITQAAIERLDRMLTSHRPAQLTLDRNMRIVARDDVLACIPPASPSASAPEAWAIPASLTGVFEVPSFAIRVILASAVGPVAKTGGRHPGRLPAETVMRRPTPDELPLSIRRRQPGDRMRPTGARGTRKLQDILIDAKVPREQRDHIPLVVSAGQVVWLPGYRIADAWRVTQPNRPYLRIRIERL